MSFFIFLEQPLLEKQRIQVVILFILVNRLVKELRVKTEKYINIFHVYYLKKEFSLVFVMWLKFYNFFTEFCTLVFIYTLVCLIIILVCYFILDKSAGGYSYCFENNLTISLLLITEIELFFLLCTILTKSFNLIII